MTQPKDMRRRGVTATIVWAVAAMMSACGGGGVENPTPPAAPPPPPGKWVILGSSTAAGMGASGPSKSWAALLQSGIAANNLQVVNLAKSGAFTYAGLPTQSTPPSGRPSPDATANVSAALAQTPKALLLSYPTNDTAANYTTAETVANLLAIRAAATAANVPLIVLSTQPRNDLSPAQLAQLVEIDSQMLAAVGACFVAVRADLAGPDSKLNPAYDADGIHPNDAGHALIHQRIRILVDSGSCVTLSAP